MRLRKSVAFCVSSVLALAVAFSADTAGASAETTTRQNTGHGKATRGIPTTKIKSIDAATQPTGRVTRSATVKTLAIPFQTIRRDTDMLYVGQRHVLTYGVEGIQQRTTTFVYIDGHRVGKKVTEKWVRHPVTEVILVGSRVRPQVSKKTVLSGRSETGFDVLKELTVVATAYVGGGTTATGVEAGPGVIAVDPSVIPLGTKVYIPGIGVVRAEDTGGAIQGNRIDICMSSTWQAEQWGVRTIQLFEIQ